MPRKPTETSSLPDELPQEPLPPGMLGPQDPLPLADPEELETFGRPSPAQDAQSKAEAEKLAEKVQQMTAKAIIPEAVATRPNWALIPAADASGQPFRFPRGRQVLFIRLKAEWTDTPLKGDRQLICWPISTGDYGFAIRRAQGDGNRVTDELTKQMMRAIDGHPADWGAATAHSPEVFWNEIGQRCRYLLTRIYIQLNTLSAKETADFFETCIAVVSPG